GRDRVAGPRPDLGAIERPLPFVVTTVNDEVAGIPGGAFVAGGVSATSFSESYNLTGLGQTDWAAWGSATLGAAVTLTPYARKAGGAGIGPLVGLSNGNPLRGLAEVGAGIPSSFNWSDGTPVASARNMFRLGVRHDGRRTNLSPVGEGFEFTVQADATPHEVRVYFSVDAGTALLTATLSDGGADPVQATFVNSSPFAGSNRGGVFTVRYSGTAQGQTLTVRLILAAANPGTDLSNVSVQAVTFSRVFADTPEVSLREAVAAANALPGPDEITFAESLSGRTIALTEGELRITDGVTIAGPWADRLTVSGSGLGRVFSVTNADRETVISGLTITGGSAFGSVFNSGTLTLAGVAIRGNQAGGVANEGTLTLVGSVVSNNTSLSGGGIWNGEGATLTVTGSVISNNRSTSGSYVGGGGLSNEGTATFIRSTISDNSTGPETAGGGGAWSSGTLTLIESTVSGNNAGGDGGGVMNYNGTLVITRSTI
ncbi:MAG: right-handed parallel beta-helix repeat-containing protein, partial [Gemmataceae bacterium]|nr:right-handed parallel beta-helix repeat-containing protein [Gemmataceae bacterium]